MRLHVAIIAAPYAALILAGRKRVESRLALTRREPFGRVNAGDTILFKARGGPYSAAATVTRVETFEDLTPDRVRALAKRFEPLVRGGRAYWESRRAARYATLMWLGEVRPIGEGPKWTPHGRGWLTVKTGSVDRMVRTNP